MKIVHEEVLIRPAASQEQPELEGCLAELREAIGNVAWPPNARTFTIRPKVDGNGVLPIKHGFTKTLKLRGWNLEQRVSLVPGLGPGKVDSLKTLPDGRQFAAEWETGNISSSHRALNKICMGILEGHLMGGVLILPDRELYTFLTQRIGNYKELAPYFPLYKTLALRGYLAVMAVSYDKVSHSVAIIPKGLDGNARRARKSTEDR